MFGHIVNKVLENEWKGKIFCLYYLEESVIYFHFDFTFTKLFLLILFLKLHIKKELKGIPFNNFLYYCYFLVMGNYICLSIAHDKNTFDINIEFHWPTTPKEITHS